MSTEEQLHQRLLAAAHISSLAQALACDVRKAESPLGSTPQGSADLLPSGPPVEVITCPACGQDLGLFRLTDHRVHIEEAE